MDPWGALVGTKAGPGADAVGKGIEVQPTIAVSEATLKMPEVGGRASKRRDFWPLHLTWPDLT